MSRQSLRKVKLTSKFEEFSTSRLASIQRQAHHAEQNQQQPQLHQQQATQQQQQQSQQPPPPPPQQPQHEPVAKQNNASITNNNGTSNNSTSTPTPASVSQAPLHTPRVAPRALKQASIGLRHSSTPKSVSMKIESPTPYSSQSMHVTPMPKLTANGKVRGRPRKHILKAESVPAKIIPSTREELGRLREENANLKTQLDQKIAEYDELQRQSSYTGQTVPKVDYDDLKLKYQRELDYAKRHEWCVVCLTPSRYYCCWNTTYCSQKCQVSDWYERHNKHCERKKALEGSQNHQQQPLQNHRL